MKEKNKEQLQAALKQLPVYKPGLEIWDRIDAQLNSETPKVIDGRSKKFSFRWQMMAAAIVLLLVASTMWVFWWESPSSVSQAPVTQAEKLITDELELTEAAIAAFENQMVEEENALKQCLEALPDAHSPDHQEAIRTLETITITRDSLSLLLGTSLERPGADRRLSRLEQRRRQLIRELREQLCE